MEQPVDSVSETPQTGKRFIDMVSPNTDSPPAYKLKKLTPNLEGHDELAEMVRILIQPLEGQLQGAMDNIETLIKANELSAGEIKRLTKENAILKEKQRGQDKYNRRTNLIFKGFTEIPNETNLDCKKRILHMLQYARIYLSPMSIELASRVGVRQNKRDRPILVRFVHSGDRDNILQRKDQIFQACNISVEEDFPLEIEVNRRELRPIMNAINAFRQNGNVKYRASLIEDKLLVNGRQYSANTHDKLPEEISTTNLSTPRRNNMVEFFSKYSPLSNYYKSEMTVENVTYSCSEQHYTHKKSLAFNDHKTAELIMNEEKPVNMKRLGSNIKNFDHKVWNSRKVEVMKIGLEAKFRDTKLRSFLLGTGDSVLMEASPFDKFWGVGLLMYNHRIWTKKNWIGTATNTMGLLLSDLRREIRHELSYQEQQPQY